MAGGTSHGTPFAATTRYLLAGYLKPVGPVERAFPMRETLSRRFRVRRLVVCPRLQPGHRPRQNGGMVLIRKGYAA
jgi:hypothetical protein